MSSSPPRAWPWTASSSPEPYPESAWIQSLEEIHPIALQSIEKESLTLEELISWLATQQFEGEQTTIEEWLDCNNFSSLTERTPFLLQGELANPYRLADLRISGMPIIPVRMDGIARVWTDVIDGREVSPGIHHVTLARTKGWWETTWLGFADKKQALTMTEWLNDGRGTNWRWSTIGEGSLSLTFDFPTHSPNLGDMEWDGEIESVSAPPPPLSGPKLSWLDVKVILFTRQGCYDNRGKLARCAHIKQRQFHDDMFRRGSAKVWNNILDLV